MKNVSELAITMTANRFPLVARCRREDSPDKSPETTQQEVVAWPNPEGEPADNPVTFESLTPGHIKSTISLHYLFENKCLCDLDSYLGHARPDATWSFWDVLEDMLGRKSFGNADCILLPRDFFDNAAESSELQRQSQQKTVLEQDIVYFTHRRFADKVFLIDQALVGQALCVQQADTCLRIICRESLWNESAVMSGWIEIGSSDNHFGIMVPWSKGELKPGEIESA
jgi:hypothetical protein